MRNSLRVKVQAVATMKNTTVRKKITVRSHLIRVVLSRKKNIAQRKNLRRK